MFESVEFMAHRETEHRVGTMASYRYDENEAAIDIFFNTDSRKTYVTAYNLSREVVSEKILRVHH